MKKINTIYVRTDDNTVGNSDRRLYTKFDEGFKCEVLEWGTADKKADLRIFLTLGGFNSTHYYKWAVRAEVKDTTQKWGYRALKFSDVFLLDALMQENEELQPALVKAKKEILQRKQYGYRVFKDLYATFSDFDAKKIKSQLDVGTIDYICTLEKERADVKRHITEQLHYALKYHSWAHFKNVVGENFPTMKNFDKMKQAIELWVTL